MDNQELIRTLDRDRLLSAVALLSQALVYPHEDFAEFEIVPYLPDAVIEYWEKLTEYERLKLIQLIINTLVHESEQSTVRHFQTLLPLKAEEFYRP